MSADAAPPTQRRWTGLWFFPVLAVAALAVAGWQGRHDDPPPTSPAGHDCLATADVNWSALTAGGPQLAGAVLFNPPERAGRYVPLRDAWSWEQQGWYAAQWCPR